MALLHQGVGLYFTESWKLFVKKYPNGTVTPLYSLDHHKASLPLTVSYLLRDNYIIASHLIRYPTRKVKLHPIGWRHFYVAVILGVSVNNKNIVCLSADEFKKAEMSDHVPDGMQKDIVDNWQSFISKTNPFK